MYPKLCGQDEENTNIDFDVSVQDQAIVKTHSQCARKQTLEFSNISDNFL